MKRNLLGLTVGVSVAFVTVSATARDLDRRYADSPLHDWFNHLARGRGLCCSMADGETIADPDWESKEGHYRVRLDSKWVDVPDEAVITEPNRAGRMMVWPIRFDEQISMTKAERHNELKSSGTSPNFLITLASLKSPVAGSPVRLNATAPV